LFICLCAALAHTSARAAERSLSLADAIDRSLGHPAVKAARESVQQARAEETRASVWPNPTVSGEAALLPLSRRYTPELPGGPTEISSGISFPIDWLLFGKRAAAITSAGAAVRIADAEFRDFIRRRTLETTHAFFAVLEAEALQAVASQAVSDLAQTEAAIQKAVASGGRAPVELHRVRIELQGAKRDERSARAELAATRASLWSLVGDGPPPGPLVLDGTLEAPLVARLMTAEDAIAVATEHRPDYQGLLIQVEKARKDEVLEARNARPEAAINLGVARQFQQSIGAPDVTAWGASVDITLPIFDRNQGNRRRARSVVVQSQLSVGAALSDLRAEVEQASQALDAAFENATDLTSTTLELAGQVRDSLRRAYDAGGRPLVDLLDAQRSYRETYQDYVRSRADYWRALAQYEAVVGTRLSR
jgi:cobalt-zinc-cadmium efflux system outer membrane protein